MDDIKASGGGSEQPPSADTVTAPTATAELTASGEADGANTDDTPPPLAYEHGVPEPDASRRIPGAHGSDALRVGDLSHRHKTERGDGRGFLDIFLPNRAVSAGTMRLIVLTEAVMALLLWLNSPFKILPRPFEVLQALKFLWLKQGLGPELMASFITNLQALLWASVIALGLAYLTVIPIFRPLVAAVSRGRFLSLVGFTLVFTLLARNGHELKTSLLVFGITVFYVTSMASIVAQVPKEEFDHARTLRMSEWRVVWEVVILGTADRAFEVLRQNAAIGWMMLTMVEGIVRSEGGVGAMLLSENKYMHLPEVFAIQFVILLVGLLQDYGIGVTRRLFCPYADLTLERK